LIVMLNIVILLMWVTYIYFFCFTVNTVMSIRFIMNV
jgi:hypothetical protein